MVVDLLDIGALPGDEWGFTGIFARENGGGFLTDHYPEAAKACWDIQGIYTSTRHIPGVRFAGITHPGLIGCAPSQELLNIWNKREKALVEKGGPPWKPKIPALAALPNPEQAILGTLKGSEFDRVAAEAARTVPPREHGGNCDLKNLSKGSRIYFPVYVEGKRTAITKIPKSSKRKTLDDRSYNMKSNTSLLSKDHEAIIWGNLICLASLLTPPNSKVSLAEEEIATFSNTSTSI